MSTEQIRAEFQWAYRAEVLKRNGKVCDWAIFLTEDDGSYVLPLVQSAWWGWQASRAALVVEGGPSHEISALVADLCPLLNLWKPNTNKAMEAKSAACVLLSTALNGTQP